MSNSVTINQVSQEMFAATEDITLVRMVGNLFFIREAASAATGHGGVVIALSRSGLDTVSLAPMTGSTAQDGREAADILWAAAWGIQRQFDFLSFPIDVKGMRKMELNDKIKVYHRADQTSVGEINMVVSMFFKRG